MHVYLGDKMDTSSEVKFTRKRAIQMKKFITVFDIKCDGEVLQFGFGQHEEKAAKAKAKQLGGKVVKRQVEVVQMTVRPTVAAQQLAAAA